MCPEVGEVKQVVGIKDSYHGEVLEVETFGYHLGTYKDIYITPGESPDDSCKGVPVPCSILVEPCHAGRGKDYLYLVLYLFSTEAPCQHPGRSAASAACRHQGLIAAIMAN